METLDVKFTKFDNRPWGFRLAGGSDFPEPLTVIRVTEESLAECMGLKVGDVVVKLNDQWINDLSHGQAHEALILAGNNFVLGVRRTENPNKSLKGIQKKIEPYMLPLEDILFSPIEVKRESTPDEVPQIEDEFAPILLSSEEKIEVEEYPVKPRDENSEFVANTNLTDEEIALLILDEEELLNEKGVLGVNFRKLRPRAPLIKQSKVFQELQQQVNSEPERIQEQKHRSTFLQKPERPVPQSRAEPLGPHPEIPASEPYRVLIQKQPRRPVSERLARRDPSKQPCPPRSPETSPTPEKTLSDSPASVIEVQDFSNDSRRQIETEIMKTEESTEVLEEYKQDQQDEITEQQDTQYGSKDQLPELVNSSMEIGEEGSVSMDENKIKELVTTEVNLERQLESVQSQLLALKQLPSEIEKHLTIVSEQLHKILELSSVEKTGVEEPAKAYQIDTENFHCQEEQGSQQSVEEVTQANDKQKLDEQQEQLFEVDEDIKSVSSESLSYTPNITSTEDTWTESKELEISVKSNEDDGKRVKKYIVSYESKVLQETHDTQCSQIPSPALSHGSFEPNPKLTLQEQLVQELKYRKGRKPARELWHPQAKQLELTYGRKWRCPNDFFNDEMIADALCSQAEVIRGRALGVNFKKFEKTALPNYDHLMNSSVFKMIHKMEVEPKKGIPTRPPKVIAAKDIIERVSTPVCCMVDDRSIRSVSH